MSQSQSNAAVSEEDAFHFIVRVLRENFIPDIGSSYGYDVHLPNIVMHYLISVGKRSHSEAQRDYRAISPAFMGAAWELARRGVLRPGSKAMGQQDTDDGSAGSGFSVTAAGRKWLKEAASHGRRSGIGDNEAYTALAVLLRFAQFANDRWADLTGKTSP